LGEALLRLKQAGIRYQPEVLVEKWFRMINIGTN
jgi:hypothetical protein